MHFCVLSEKSFWNGAHPDSKNIAYVGQLYFSMRKTNCCLDCVSISSKLSIVICEVIVIKLTKSFRLGWMTKYPYTKANKFPNNDLTIKELCHRLTRLESIEPVSCGLSVGYY